MKRILIYSHDTYGLGNIRRMAAIAEHLVRSHDDYAVMILSGSPMLQAFRLSERIDYIKLPCLQRDEAGHYDTRYLPMSPDAIVALRARLILDAVTGFCPDLILVDKKPTGVNNELMPLLDYLGTRQDRPDLVLVLREILDTPESTREVWERNGYHDIVRDYYQRVLVLGPQSVFDTAREYGFPASTRKRLDHCGYVRKQHPIRSADTVRASLGFTSRHMAVLTTGGGQDGERLLQAGLSGLPPRLDALDLDLLVVLGPQLPADRAAVLKRQAQDKPRVHLLDFTDDMASYLNAADLVISMAGYNTVTETLGLGKQSVLVPRVAPGQEQLIRATCIEKLGCATLIHPDDLSADALYDAVHSRLFGLGTDAYFPRIDIDALDDVDRRLTRMLDKRSQRRHTLRVPLPTNGAIRTARGHSSYTDLDVYRARRGLSAAALDTADNDHPVRELA